MIDFLVQVPNLEFALEIDLVIILRSESIASFRAVLAHHNDRRLQCSQAGEDEIKENKRVGIERARGEEDSIYDDPDDQDAAESDDKFQAPAKLCDLMNSASEGRRLSPIAPFCGMNARPQSGNSVFVAGSFHSFQINGVRPLLVDSTLNERLAILD
jgi:hypothetical protein